MGYMTRPYSGIVFIVLTCMDAKVRFFLSEDREDELQLAMLSDIDPYE